jgi:hypothetical protein
MHVPAEDAFDFPQKQTKLRDGIFGVGRDGQPMIGAD